MGVLKKIYSSVAEIFFEILWYFCDILIWKCCSFSYKLEILIEIFLLLNIRNGFSFFQFFIKSFLKFT